LNGGAGLVGGTLAAYVPLCYLRPVFPQGTWKELEEHLKNNVEKGRLRE
jgi:hypothetical protein